MGVNPFGKIPSYFALVACASQKFELLNDRVKYSSTEKALGNGMKWNVRTARKGRRVK